MGCDRCNEVVRLGNEVNVQLALNVDLVSRPALLQAFDAAERCGNGEVAGFQFWFVQAIGAWLRGTTYQHNPEFIVNSAVQMITVRCIHELLGGLVAGFGQMPDALGMPPALPPMQTQQPLVPWHDMPQSGPMIAHAPNAGMSGVMHHPPAMRPVFAATEMQQLVAPPATAPVAPSVVMNNPVINYGYMMVQPSPAMPLAPTATEMQLSVPAPATPAVHQQLVNQPTPPPPSLALPGRKLRAEEKKLTEQEMAYWLPIAEQTTPPDAMVIAGWADRNLTFYQSVKSYADGRTDGKEFRKGKRGVLAQAAVWCAKGDWAQGQYTITRRIGKTGSQVKQRKAAKAAKTAAAAAGAATG